MSPRPAQPLAQPPELPLPLEWLQRIAADLRAYKARTIRALGVDRPGKF
jgi:hypothetical protein